MNRGHAPLAPVDLDSALFLTDELLREPLYQEIDQDADSSRQENRLWPNDRNGGNRRHVRGARSSSEASASGPYFLEFARRARKRTSRPLMQTGGFKSLSQARDAVARGAVNIVGLALEPALPNRWRSGQCADLVFPRFDTAPEGGVTAWYTMRLTQLGEDREIDPSGTLEQALFDYAARDRVRTANWRGHFLSSSG